MGRSTFLLAILLTSCIAGLGSADCKDRPRRLILWEKLFGMWYNTYSHEGDALQMKGRCNTMVVAGKLSFEGVAIIKNVMPENAWDKSSNVSTESINPVTEFLVAIDPGVYTIDPASQLQWMDIAKLQKFMTRTETANFLNAISGQYTGKLVVTTNYGDFLIFSQCHCNTKVSVWVYTKEPKPSPDVLAVVKQHLDNRLFDYKLHKNEACHNYLDRMFENSHPK